LPLRLHRDDAIGTAAASGQPLGSAGQGSQAALDVTQLVAWLLHATTLQDAMPDTGSLA
jgi:hypothetical protein